MICSDTVVFQVLMFLQCDRERKLTSSTTHPRHQEINSGFPHEGTVNDIYIEVYECTNIHMHIHIYFQKYTDHFFSTSFIPTPLWHITKLHHLRLSLCLSLPLFPSPPLFLFFFSLSLLTLSFPFPLFYPLLSYYSITLSFPFPLFYPLLSYPSITLSFFLGLANAPTSLLRREMIWASDPNEDM